MASNEPIGVFDSGVGGLAVVEQIRKLLPREDIVYYADRGHFPYGPKSAQAVLSLSISAVEFLLSKRSKLIVVACNTASAAALSELRQQFKIPFVGVVPAIKPASLQTRSGKIGVIATEGTLHAEMFQGLVEQFASGLEVVTVACPLLVEFVEEGRVGGPELELALHSYIDPILESGADTLVLGCTHYSFLKEAVERIAGPEVAVLETSKPVAKQVQRLLQENDLLSETADHGLITYYASGDLENFNEVKEKLFSVRAVE
ncbi:MAG: glutamate racemase [Dehalococcoidia bacterium]|nr:glutamate racemase [Dehalococcoidia bacterium]